MVLSASIASIVRVKYFYEVGRMSDLNDEESRGGNNIKLQIWSIVELGLAILAACLSALRPLLRFLTGRASANDSASGQMTGHYIMQPREHELPEIGTKASSAWTGSNKFKSAQPGPMVNNDSQETILNMDSIQQHASRDREIR